MRKLAELTTLLSLLGRSFGFATELCSHDEVVDSIKNNIRCEMMIVEDLLDRNIINGVNLSSNDAGLELLRTLEPTLILNTAANLLECAALAVTCLSPGFWMKIPQAFGINVRSMISQNTMGQNFDRKDEEGFLVEFDKGNDCIHNFGSIANEYEREEERCLNRTIQFIDTAEDADMTQFEAGVPDDVCSQIEKDVKCAVSIKVSCLSDRENTEMRKFFYQIRDHVLDIEEEATVQAKYLLGTAPENAFPPEFMNIFDFFARIITCGLGSSTSTNKDYTYVKSFDSLMAITNKAHEEPETGTQGSRDTTMINSARKAHVETMKIGLTALTILISAIVH